MSSSSSFSVASLTALAGSDWPFSSVVGLLTTFALPFAAAFAVCLRLLWQARFRRCLLSTYLLTRGSRWEERLHAHVLGRVALSCTLLGSFALSAVLLALLAAVAVLMLPLLFALILLYLLLLLCACALWLSLCSARAWRVDAASLWAVRLCAAAVGLAEAATVYFCDAAGGLVGWSALLLTANALPLLVLAYRGEESEHAVVSAATIAPARAVKEMTAPDIGAGTPSAAAPWFGPEDDSVDSVFATPAPRASPTLAQRSALSAALLYGASVAALCLWSWLMAALSFGFFAAASSAGLVVLDVVVLLLSAAQQRAGYRQRPAHSAALLLAARVAVALSGDQRYLIGHAALFAVFFTYTWRLLLDAVVPARLTRSDRSLSGSDTVVVPASSPPPAAAVAVPPPAPTPWPLLPPLSRGFAHVALLALCLWLTVLLFGADCAATALLVARGTLSVDGVQWSSAQSTGISALLSLYPSLLCALAVALLVLEWAGLSLAWRLYCNARCRITPGCAVTAALCYGAVAAAGALLAAGNGSGSDWDSPSGLAALLLFFLPALALLSVHALCQLWLRDFRFAVDVRLLALCAAIAGLAAALGASVWWLCSPAWLGPALCVGAFVLAFTALPALRWFHSFHWSRAMSAQMAAAMAGLLCLCLFLFLHVRAGVLDGVAFALLCLALLYPAAVALLLGLGTWADDGWALSPAALWATLSGLFVLTLFCFLCALLYPPWYYGTAALAAALAAVVAVAMRAPAVGGGDGRGGGGGLGAFNGRAVSPLSARLGRSAALLLLCAVPVVAGLATSDGWLAVTALTAALLLALLVAVGSVAGAYHAAALPALSSSRDELSTLCRPPSSYLLACGDEWLGLYTVPAVSGDDSAVSPPRSLRPLLLALHSAALLLLVWGQLAFFFPFASAAPSLDIDPTAAGQGDVSLVCISAAALLSALLCLHYGWCVRVTETAFALDIAEVRSAATGGSASSGRPVEACGQDEDDDNAEGSLPEREPSADSALRLLRTARARAKRSVHVVLPAASLPASSSSASSLFVARSRCAASASNGSVDERRAFSQAFEALTARATLCPLRPAAGFVSGTEYSAASALVAAHDRWRSQAALFVRVARLQLHHALVAQRHARLQRLLAMAVHFESQARREERVTLPYLALLSLHHRERPAPAMVTFERALPAWQSYRAALQRAAQANRAEQEGAKKARADVAAALRRRVDAERAEALAQRRAERLKQLRIARELDDERRVERRAAVRRIVEQLQCEHRSQLKEWLRGVKAHGGRVRVGADGADGTAATSPETMPATSESARRQRITAKRRQQKLWLHKQRLIAQITGHSEEPSAAVYQEHPGADARRGAGLSAVPPTGPTTTEQPVAAASRVCASQVSGPADAAWRVRPRVLCAAAH